MSEPGITTLPASPLRPFAETIAWLWRIPLREEPSAATVAFGGIEEAPELEALMRAGDLAGVALLAARPGPDAGLLAGRERRNGVAEFDEYGSLQGQFTVLHSPGDPLAGSSLGVHALRHGDWLTLGYDPQVSWGTLDGAWALPALAEFLTDALDVTITKLPAVGVVRYDDVPGTAAHQLAGDAKSDHRVSRKLRRQIGAFSEADGVLNLAVACRGLIDGNEAPLERIWPRSLELIAEAIQRGSVEQLCHGYLHVDTERTTGARVEPREFEALDREEAARRIGAALDWAATTLGRRPTSFVAPNWSYSEGTLAELDALGLPAWLPARLGPLLQGGNVRESLVSTLDGIAGLDYRPLASLAAHGLPPVVVVHGGLMDGRMQRLRRSKGVATLARLAVKRDLPRLAEVDGLRWIAASELIGLLREHGR